MAKKKTTQSAQPLFLSPQEKARTYLSWMRALGAGRHPPAAVATWAREVGLTDNQRFELLYAACVLLRCDVVYGAPGARGTGSGSDSDSDSGSGRGAFIAAVGLSSARRWQVYIGMEFIERASFSQFCFVMYHEALHIVRRDLTEVAPLVSKVEAARPDLRAHQVVNIALDLANNARIRAALGDPDRWLRDPATGTAAFGALDARTIHTQLPGAPEAPLDRLAVDYLDYLCRYLPPQCALFSGDGGGAGSGACSGDGASPPMWEDEHIDGPSDMSPEERARHMREHPRWRDSYEAAERAMRAAALRDVLKSAGSLPAHLRSELEAALDVPATPWQAILAGSLRSALGSDLRAAPSRPRRGRFIYGPDDPMEELECVYPGQRTEPRSRVAFVVDTSGSMSEADIVTGLGEVIAIVRDHPGAELWLLQCDSYISHAQRFTATESEADAATAAAAYVREVGRTSGGGTSFQPIFDLDLQLRRGDPGTPTTQVARELPGLGGRGFDVIIYVTDGYAPEPAISVPPSTLVVWVATQHSNQAMSAWRDVHVVAS